MAVDIKIFEGDVVRTKEIPSNDSLSKKEFLVVGSQADKIWILVKSDLVIWPFTAELSNSPYRNKGELSFLRYNEVDEIVSRGSKYYKVNRCDV